MNKARGTWALEPCTMEVLRRLSSLDGRAQGFYLEKWFWEGVSREFPEFINLLPEEAPEYIKRAAQSGNALAGKA